jgi:hypothetical protein
MRYLLADCVFAKFARQGAAEEAASFCFQQKRSSLQISAISAISGFSNLIV